MKTLVTFFSVFFSFLTFGQSNVGSRADAILVDEIIAPDNSKFRGYKNNRDICFEHCPTIQESSPGKFVVAWYVSDQCEEEDLSLAVSYNHGNGWSDPAVVVNSCYNPALFQPKRDPNQPLYLYSRRGITSNGWAYTSPDDGISWRQASGGTLFELASDAAAPREGSLLPDSGGNVCTQRYLGPIKNPPLELPDGSALMPSSTECAGSNWKAHMEIAPYQNYEGSGSGNWGYAAVAEDVIQPSILVLSGDYQKLKATGRFGGDIQTADSNDGGRSWTKGRPIRGVGKRGHDSYTLDNGYHVIVAESNNRKSIYVSVSSDGTNFDNVIELNKDAGGAYPTVIQSADRKIHVVYSQFTKNPTMHIRHVVLDPDKLVGKGNGGPSISAQPVDFNGAIGGVGSFNVTASGTGSLYYQWQRNTGNGLWHDVERMANFSTETIKQEMNGWKYRVVISDNNGSTVSNVATLSTTGGGNNPPTVSITSPADGSTFTAPASITINATASDADGSIAKVEFFNGNTLLGTDTTAPYSYNWSNVGAGSYSITAKAYDDKGATAIAGAVNITITDPVNELPVVSISSPTNGATFTAPAIITINATATDADGSIAKVEFFNGNVLLGTDTTAPYSYNWSNVGAGSYSITAKAYDDKGATATSTAVNLTVTDPANELPTVSITSPADGSTFTAPASITINATATDADGSIAKVEFFSGNVLLGTDTTAPYSYNWSNVGASSYSIMAKAYDDKGATATSTAVNLTVTDPTNELPTVSITSPSDGDTFAAPANITINATATDADGSIAKVEFFSGNVLLGTDTTAPYSYNWSNVRAGSYSITAKAYDDKGATATAGAVNVTVTSTMNQPPVLAITAPIDGTVFTVGSDITAEVTATDPDGNITKVEFYVESFLLATDTTAPYSATSSNVPAGTYTITAVAYDNNNASTTSDPVTIVISSTTSISDPDEEEEGDGTVDPDEEKVMMYPNPSVGIVNIQGVSKETSIDVYNSIGLKVLSVKGEQKIDLSQQNKGLYLVRVKHSRESKTIVKTIIVK